MADERLIPESIRDANTRALAGLMERMGTLDVTPILVYLIDQVNPAALQHLGEQFHVTGFEGLRLATNDVERRAVIKGAIERHRYKGTRYAIDLALGSLGITYTLQEWWQYGGAPYHFRVTLDVMGSELPSETLALLDSYISEYKNERSVLDTIDVNLSVSGVVPVIAIGLQSSEIITVYPQ